MTNEINKLYEFGEFRLDTKERVLFRQDETIILAAKVFDTLETLVKKQGSIVSKNDLMEEIWSDSFVEEGNLTQNIYLLRQTLGKEFIETVPRRGYRFTAPVKVSSIEHKKTVNSDIDKGFIVATKTKTHIIEEEETSLENTNQNTTLTKTQKSTFSGWKKWFAVTIATALIFAVAFWGYKSFQNQQTGNSPRILANIEFDKLTNTGYAFSPTISPDGKFMAYIKRDFSGQTLQLKDTESGNDVELQIENDVRPQYLKFSPIGNKIYFRSSGRLESPRKIYEISYFGGRAKLVAENVWGHFSISPNGKQVAFYRSEPTKNKQYLVVKNLENGEEKEFAERVLPKGLFMLVAPAWSANEKKIAFVPVQEKSNRSEIVFVDLETGKEELIKTDLIYIRQIVFLPDDQNLILVARDKFFQIFKLNYTNGSFTRITNDLSNYRNLSITSDGKKIVTQQRKINSNAWLIPDADLNNAKPLTENGYYGLYDLAFTKNNDLVFDARGKINRNLEFIKTDSKNTLVLSRDENTNNNHSPTSDKKGNIYFVSDQSGSLNIWRVRSDGTNLKQITFGKKGELNIAPSVSLDDEWLYFIKKSGETNTIWKTSLLEENKTEKIFEAKDFSFGRFLSISPDGNWLAFHYMKANQTGDNQNEDNSRKTKFGFLNLSDKEEIKTFEITTNRIIIRWTNGGKAFDYYQSSQAEGKIWRQDFSDNPSPPRLVFQLPQARILHFDWSPDEKDLVIIKSTTRSDAVLLQLAK